MFIFFGVWSLVRFSYIVKCNRIFKYYHIFWFFSFVALKNNRRDKVWKPCICNTEFWRRKTQERCLYPRSFRRSFISRCLVCNFVERVWVLGQDAGRCVRRVTLNRVFKEKKGGQEGRQECNVQSVLHDMRSRAKDSIQLHLGHTRVAIAVFWPPEEVTTSTWSQSTWTVTQLPSDPLYLIRNFVCKIRNRVNCTHYCLHSFCTPVVSTLGLSVCLHTFPSRLWACFCLVISHSQLFPLHLAVF